MKIVMPELDTLTRGDVDVSGFSAHGELKVVPYEEWATLPEELADAEVLFVNKTLVTPELLRKADNLRYIGECATGYNNIDLEYCNTHGITVTNVPAYSTQAVAQHVFAFLLDHYSRVHEYNDFVRTGEWTRSHTFSRFDLDTEELAGKTIGLIGFGQIGKQVARIARAFDMDVVAYSRSRCEGLNPGEEAFGFGTEDEGVRFLPLSDLLATAEIVSIHCPLNEESEGLFDTATFARMREGAFLINTARGPIVNEAALLSALQSGRLSGAAVDVLETEPMREDCVLPQTERCLITPHVAWAPRSTRQRLIDLAVGNLEAFLQGTPVNVVNDPDLH